MSASATPVPTPGALASDLPAVPEAVRVSGAVAATASHGADPWAVVPARAVRRVPARARRFTLPRSLFGGAPVRDNPWGAAQPASWAEIPASGRAHRPAVTDSTPSVDAAGAGWAGRLPRVRASDGTTARATAESAAGSRSTAAGSSRWPRISIRVCDTKRTSSNKGS